MKSRGRIVYEHQVGGKKTRHLGGWSACRVTRDHRVFFCWQFVHSGRFGAFGADISDGTFPMLRRRSRGQKSREQKQRAQSSKQKQNDCAIQTVAVNILSSNIIFSEESQNMPSKHLLHGRTNSKTRHHFLSGRLGLPSESNCDRQGIRKNRFCRSHQAQFFRVFQDRFWGDNSWHLVLKLCNVAWTRIHLVQYCFKRN